MVGGLIYVPLCLWELKMGPLLHQTVYGFNPSGWYGVLFGGYRPQVFMSCGLELAMWMVATSVIGFWLWASGTLKRLWDVSFASLLLVLVVVTVLCRGTGATLLLGLGLTLWFALKWTKARLPALVLLALGPLYLFVRSAGVWSGAEATEMVRSMIGQGKAASLQTRLDNEAIHVIKAFQRPVFGWGGWGRFLIYDEKGRRISIPDGMWIIALGDNGLVGLISFSTSLLLPMAIMVKRYPVAAWRHPSLAPAGAFAILLNLYLMDCLANAMINPIYLLSLGSVLGVLDHLDTNGERASFEALTTESDSTGKIAPVRHAPAAIGTHPATGTLASPDPRELSAIRHGRLGRSLKGQGRIREAEVAWLSALRSWSQLAAEFPDVPEYRQRWLDGHNDLAWLLLTAPDRRPRDISRAILLAEKAVERAPECGAYRNTLGIAYFRAGDWKAAIAALERSIEFGAGGTSFDYFFLGMAYWWQGDEAQAHHRCARAEEWMERNGPEHEDLLRFRAEAIALLDCHTPSS